MAKVTPEAIGTYCRPIPSGWEQLTAVAQTELGSGDDEASAYQAANLLLDTVKTLDDESVEGARYYGIGLVMCGVAKALQEPGVRKGIIGRASDNIVARQQSWRYSDPKPLRIFDLDELSMKWQFRDTVYNAYSALPRSAQLVADVLHYESSERRSLLEASASTFMDDRDYEINKILCAQRTAGLVLHNFTAATEVALSTALEKREMWKYEQVNQQYILPQESAVAELPSHKAAQAIIDPQELRRLDIESIASRCAVLRLDEFVNHVKSYIDTTPDGALVFRRELVKPSRNLAAPDMIGGGAHRTAVLHHTRLRCPAVFVAGMIPMVLGIVTETLASAQEKISDLIAEQREFEEAYQSHAVVANHNPVGW